MGNPNILIFMVDQLNGILFPDGPADWLHGFEERLALDIYPPDYHKPEKRIE